MNVGVAVEADGDAVIDIESDFGMRREREQVVGVDAFRCHSALLADTAVSRHDRTAPAVQLAAHGTALSQERASAFPTWVARTYHDRMCTGRTAELDAGAIYLEPCPTVLTVGVSPAVIPAVLATPASVGSRRRYKERCAAPLTGLLCLGVRAHGHIIARLEPKYAQVCIDRWEAFTGEKAVKA